MNPILDSLNPVQREAVTHVDGPLLVLAGAGSGKTRVITHRIAHLIVDRGVDPSRIVAVTFTNKAAGEMRERVERLLGYAPRGSWIGTFHALCLRMLRRDGARVGLRSGFNVYDTTDQLSVVRQILKEEQPGDAATKARPILSRISRAKNALEGPEDLLQRARTPDMRLTALVFESYQEALRQANAVDFDDILLRTLELLGEHPDVAEVYAEHCRYLLVDEYQDTNRPQYLLVRALSARHGNVCVVGDEDQSIYRFRGAEIRNILEFEQDHPGARTIKLEQNYRSTPVILEAAGAVISRNRRRKGKKLWTEQAGGERIRCYHAATDRAEAEWVASTTRELGSDHPYEQIAVLYRTNAQSRQFEEIFRRDRIPYQVVGSVQFYERKEVKDLLAYLKLVANNDDGVAFRRIVNTPTRGIGDTTVRTIEDVARGHSMSMMAAARLCLEQALLSGRATSAVARFVELIDGAALLAGEQPLPVLLDWLLERLDYEGYLEKTYPGQGLERMENVRALVTASVEFLEESEDASLQAFLDRSALVADADDVGTRPGVTLMTIHCAKGLEFDVVFLAGLEDGLFPHQRSTESEEDMEEERRLCYVALTRARQRLLLSYAGMRRMQGLLLPVPPSRFLQELPGELIDDIHPAPAEQGFERGVWERPGSSAALAAQRRRRPGGPSRKPPRGEDPGDGYAVGADVRHPEFGAGYITARAGSGKNLKLTIQFSRHGSKKILPAYTKLQVQDR